MAKTKFPSVELKHIYVDEAENYRKELIDEDIAGLKASFLSWHEATGGRRWMHTPVILTRISPSKYIPLAGFQRIEASRQLVEEGHAWAAQIHATVMTRSEYSKLGETGTQMLALTENVRRSNPSDIDTAHALKAVMDSDPKLTQAALAKRLGVTPRWVGQRLGLLRANTERVQAALDSGKIAFSHARDLGRIDDAALQDAVLDAYVEAADEGKKPVYSDLRTLVEKSVEHPGLEPKEVLDGLIEARTKPEPVDEEPEPVDEEPEPVDEEPEPVDEEPEPEPVDEEPEPEPVDEEPEPVDEEPEPAPVEEEHVPAPVEEEHVLDKVQQLLVTKLDRERYEDALEEVEGAMLAMNRAYVAKDVPEYAQREVDIKKAFFLGAHAVLAQLGNPKEEYVDVDKAWDAAMSVQGNRLYAIAHMRKLAKKGEKK